MRYINPRFIIIIIIIIIITAVYILLHFRNTSDENVLSDSLDLFGHIKMPRWLNMHLTGILNTGTDNTWSEQ